jgi:hypothetical protein
MPPCEIIQLTLPGSDGKDGMAPTLEEGPSFSKTLLTKACVLAYARHPATRRSPQAARP